MGKRWTINQYPPALFADTSSARVFISMIVKGVTSCEITRGSYAAAKEGKKRVDERGERVFLREHRARPERKRGFT